MSESEGLKMACSFDRIQSVLDELKHECPTEGPWYCRIRSEMARVGQFFKIDLRFPSSWDLWCIIKKSENDWRFLRMFVDFSVKWSDADKVVVQDLGQESLIVKIDAAAHEMAEDLGQACRKKYIWRKRAEIFNLMLDWERKIEAFKVENHEAFVNYMSVCSASFQVQSPFHDYSLWTKFLDSVKQNLLSVVKLYGSNRFLSFHHALSAVHTELSLIQQYLNEVAKFFKSAFCDDHVTEEFLILVASVVVRTAARSFNCWFIQRDSVEAEDRVIEFRDLEHEIDPTNPGFVELHLKLLRALNKFDLNDSFNGISIEQEFVHYLLGLSRSNALHVDLVFLVSFVVNTKLEDSCEDVQSFMLETSALLAEAASEPLRKHGNNGGCRTLLRTKIFLLKVEAFLKKQAMHPGEHQVGELNKVLEYLSEDSSEFGKKVSAVLKEVAMEVASLYQSFQAKDITEHGVRNSLLLLLFKILFLKAESFLKELLDADSILIVNGKDQIESLSDHLKIFRLYVKSQPVKNTDDVDMRLIDIEAISRRILVFFYAYHANKITEEMIKNMSLSFSDLLEKVKLFKPKLRKLCPFPSFNVPRIHELGFIDLLLGNLGELLEHNPDSIAPVRHHINEIHSDLKSMRSFLVKTLDSGTEDPKLKDLVYHVTDVAYRVEYVVESIEIDAEWQHFLWYYDLIEEIRHLKIQISGIHEMNLGAVVLNVTQVSDHIISRASETENDELVVDLKDEEKVIIIPLNDEQEVRTSEAKNDEVVVDKDEEEVIIIRHNDEEEVIINRLTRGPLQRDIVSIVGMPGIGKTTLAKKVYDDPNVTCHFHCRAWCIVSQVHDKRKMLLQILSDLHELPEEILDMTNEVLESKLRQSLLMNRYLIVMDDVWDIRAWNDLENSFPDNTNGSRVLMTSRLHDAVLKANPRNDPHHLCPLTDEESWKLLERKTFKKEGCPEELLVVAKQIAQCCEGLPLAVVAISGLLRRTAKRRDRWENIAASLSSRLLNDPKTQCMKILELSYKHLPENLKACFLYVGAFPGDKDVPVSKLIQLWIAEGFLQETGLKNLEEVAEGYLMDLIDRSLVIVSKRRSNGKVKSCRLHNLLRDLCHLKAKAGNFLQVVTNCDEPYASFHGLDHGYELYYSHPLGHVKYESHRLSFFLKRWLFVDSKPSGPCTRSIIFFAFTDTYPRCPYDISFLYQNFKLLRVLDLECINIGTSFPDEIGLLVHLRFLAVSGDLYFIPRSLADLWKLETLIVKGLRGVVVLPGSIWRMARLRYLHVNKYVAFNLQDDSGDSSKLRNLVSFSCPFFFYGEDTDKIIRRLPNLLKLSCILLESRNSLQMRNQFLRLDFLSQLESLKIIYMGRVLYHSGLNLPSSLKQLTLSNFHLSCNHISVIGKLKHLEVLKLLSCAFEEQKWDMKKEEFQELKFLKLHNMGIEKWNAYYDHLPRLQRLVLQSCEDLKVPDDFANITTLEVIEVQKCGKSTEQSAREIGEATEEIKVLVSH